MGFQITQRTRSKKEKQKPIVEGGQYSGVESEVASLTIISPMLCIMYYVHIMEAAGRHLEFVCSQAPSRLQGPELIIIMYNQSTSRDLLILEFDPRSECLG